MNKIIFVSKEEAEQKTGYFFVDSILITCSLYEKIDEYINKNGLMTYCRSNLAKTSNNTYTLNFTLKHYYNRPDKPKNYISKGGALGIYSKARDAIPIVFEALQKRSPTIEDMYFWIARKYPSHILWMKYSMEKKKSLEDFFHCK